MLRTVLPIISLLISAFFLSGCASTPSLATAPHGRTKLVIVLVGGNSESIHGGGIWGLYQGRSQATDKPILSTILETTKLLASEVATYYFSWTGDDEDDHVNVLPSHWNWIFGGPARIEASLNNVLAYSPLTTQLLVVGWSNGGATAYELTCKLATKRTVNLLITLDPVAWTTKACARYSNNELSTPSKWIDVYTASGPSSRLATGNIIALLGRAWDDDKLPSKPTELAKLSPANHGDTKDMWEKRVLVSSTYREWASSFAK